MTKNSVSCCGHNGFVVGDEFYMAGGATGSLEERKRKCWSPCHVHQLDLQQLKWTKVSRVLGCRGVFLTPWSMKKYQFWGENDPYLLV